MNERFYKIKISPENIKGDLFIGVYQDGFITGSTPDDCCDIITTTTTIPITGITGYYKPMSEVLSGGTGGSSLLTQLSVPIFLTQTAIDIGYYSVFDGAITQKDVITNFIFSGTVTTPNTFFFYNTSDKEFKKYLEFSNYEVDWGDGTPKQIVNDITPYSHQYVDSGDYVITLTGSSPWGTNIVKKNIKVPFSNVNIPNPNGTAFFVPKGGSWSGTPLSYDYINYYDQECEEEIIFPNTPISPFIVSGYTESTINDLQVYGKKQDLYQGKFKLGIPVTGTSGVEGVVYGPSIDDEYISYTINGIDYYDYPDGTTIFVVTSSGLTEDMLVCSAITKNELLMNIIDEVEIQSNVFIERGKNSALERLERLGEVDNLGDLEKYGYKFFNLEKQ
jgi:hypothetical protein